MQLHVLIGPWAKPFHGRITDSGEQLEGSSPFQGRRIAVPIDVRCDIITHERNGVGILRELQRWRTGRVRRMDRDCDACTCTSTIRSVADETDRGSVDTALQTTCANTRHMICSRTLQTAQGNSTARGCAERTDPSRMQSSDARAAPRATCLSATRQAHATTMHTNPARKGSTRTHARSRGRGARRRGNSPDTTSRSSTVANTCASVIMTG